MREFLWPRKGLLRPLRYYRLRILRLGATPHSIAIGFSTGIAMAWTPFLGFHLGLALILSYLLSGNLVAAALGTTLSNPATFPVICAVTWETGRWLIGGDAATGADADLVDLLEKMQFRELWAPVLKPMLVGALPLALGSAVILYTVIFFAVRGFQRRRHLQRMRRQHDALAGALGGDIPSV